MLEYPNVSRLATSKPTKINEQEWPERQKSSQVWCPENQVEAVGPKEGSTRCIQSVGQGRWGWEVIVRFHAWEVNEAV